MILLIGLLFAMIHVVYVVVFISGYNDYQRDRKEYVKYEQVRMLVWTRYVFLVLLALNLYWWGWTYYHWQLPSFHVQFQFLAKAIIFGVLYSVLLRHVTGRFTGSMRTAGKIKLPFDFYNQDWETLVQAYILYYAYLDVPYQVHSRLYLRWPIMFLTLYLNVPLTELVYPYLWVDLCLLTFNFPGYVFLEQEFGLVEWLGPLGRERLYLGKCEWGELVKRAEEMMRQRWSRRFKTPWTALWDDKIEDKEKKVILKEVISQGWYHVYRIEQWRRRHRVDRFMGRGKHRRRVYDDPVYREQMLFQQEFIDTYYMRYPHREYGSTRPRYKDSPRRRDLNCNFKLWPRRVWGQWPLPRQIPNWRLVPPRIYGANRRSLRQRIKDFLISLFILPFVSLWRSFTRALLTWLGS